MITTRPSGRNAPDDGGDFLGAAHGIGLVTGLDHYSNHRLGTGRTQDDTALAPPALRHLLYGALDLGKGLRVELFRHFHVDHGLREARHACGQFREALPRLAHDREHLEAGHHRVAGGGLVEQQDVPGRLTTHFATVLTHHREHVAVADLCALEVDALLPQRHFEAEVAHDSSDDGPLQSSRPFARSRNDVNELVAIDDASESVDHDESIAVAVERNA